MLSSEPNDWELKEREELLIIVAYSGESNNADLQEKSIVLLNDIP